MNKIAPTGRICLTCGKPIAEEKQRCQKCAGKLTEATNDRKWRLAKAKHKKFSRNTSAPDKHL